MRKSLLLCIFLLYVCILSSCILEYKANTKTYLKFSKNNKENCIVKKEELIVHELSIVYDSSDLTSYDIKSFYRLNSVSIQKAFEKFGEKYKDFYKDFSYGNHVHFDTVIDVKVNIRERVYGDKNNHTALRKIETTNIKQPFTDDNYHLLSQVIFRQDICVGCAFSGYGNEMHAVIHYKYAIVKKGELLYYREIFVPNAIESTKRNRENPDAGFFFNQKMTDVLFHYLKKDLDKMLIKE
jgi:hypothetical protein